VFVDLFICVEILIFVVGFFCLMVLFICAWSVVDALLLVLFVLFYVVGVFVCVFVVFFIYLLVLEADVCF